MIINPVQVMLCPLLLVCGHGRLMDPPARNAMWRFGYPNPVNYNDNELFCGGYAGEYLSKLLVSMRNACAVLIATITFLLLHTADIGVQCNGNRMPATVASAAMRTIYDHRDHTKRAANTLVASYRAFIRPVR